jgi:hypothetical protein
MISALTCAPRCRSSAPAALTPPLPPLPTPLPPLPFRRRRVRPRRPSKRPASPRRARTLRIPTSRSAGSRNARKRPGPGPAEPASAGRAGPPRRSPRRRAGHRRQDPLRHLPAGHPGRRRQARGGGQPRLRSCSNTGICALRRHGALARRHAARMFKRYVEAENALNTNTIPAMLWLAEATRSTRASSRRCSWARAQGQQPQQQFQQPQQQRQQPQPPERRPDRAAGAAPSARSGRPLTSFYQIRSIRMRRTFALRWRT